MTQCDKYFQTAQSNAYLCKALQSALGLFGFDSEGVEV